MNFMKRILLLLLLTGCHRVRVSEAGTEADQLARRMERAVHKDAWDRTGAVRFIWNHQREHLWDRRRGFDRVRFIGNDQEVLLDIGKQDGRAYRNHIELQGPERQELITRAYKAFCNDTFWLNPLAKLFDDGVTRSRTSDATGEHLIAEYASGGVTPGDRYDWIVGENDLPRAWRLYVKVIPVRGLEMTWEGWQPLSTGALVATEHQGLGKEGVTLQDVSGASTLQELTSEAGDPFAPLLAS
jgi:hypothetical protein